LKNQRSEREIREVHFLEFDTILSPFQEQNRPSKMPLSIPRIMMPRIEFRYWILVLLASLVSSGCGPKASEPIAETPASARPPLKIWIVDAPELEKEISIRWQAASDQSLKIENIAASEIAAREPFVADVVIFPSWLLGQLVQKQAVSKLPNEALVKRELSSTDANSAESQTLELKLPDAKTMESLTAAWPTRWRNAATFANQLYAVPLGATNQTIALVGLNPEPLNELSQRMSGGRDLNTPAWSQWTLFLDETQKALQTNEADRKKILDEQLAKMGQPELAYLTDRFLFIASTTNAKTRGMFDLVQMTSRLGHPDFVLSAKILARMALLFPESIAAEPTKSWEMLASKSDETKSAAIGWPSSVAGAASDSFTNSEASGKVVVSRILRNSGNGLIASLGRKTRQTAVSCQFLVWLAEPEQREALQAVCSRIELPPEQNDRNNIRPDYRAFQVAQSREARSEPMELSLRMANADQYRALLSKSLVDAIQKPDKIDSIMANSATQWDELTTKLGIDSQRISEEQSLGYRK